MNFGCEEGLCPSCNAQAQATGCGGTARCGEQPHEQICSRGEASRLAQRSEEDCALPRMPVSEELSLPADSQICGECEAESLEQVGCGCGDVSCPVCAVPVLHTRPAKLSSKLGWCDEHCRQRSWHDLAPGPAGVWCCRDETMCRNPDEQNRHLRSQRRKK